MWFFFHSSQQLIWRMLHIFPTKNSHFRRPTRTSAGASAGSPWSWGLIKKPTSPKAASPGDLFPRGWHWGGTRPKIPWNQDPGQQKKPRKKIPSCKKNVFSWWSHLKSYPWKGPAQNPAWMTLKTLKAWSLADLAKSGCLGCLESRISKLPGWDFSNVLVYRNRMGPLYKNPPFQQLASPMVVSIRLQLRACHHPQ